MNQSAGERGSEFYAQSYDDSVPDWPGEINFYRDLAAGIKSHGGTVLEIACGTGRVAIRLAQDRVNVVGLDLSPKMLKVARQKSAGLQNMRWVEGDMRSFDLGETFELALIPGHAFQNLLTPGDQVACLECIRRHLSPGGVLVVHLDHQDVGWLGDLLAEKKGVFEPGEEFTHPQTGRLVRASHAWSYEPATQTASVVTAWEEFGADGNVVDRWERGPIPLHCVFRFEMEHLLARTGFEIDAVYGDFFRQELRDDSANMIWIARRFT